LLVRVVQNGWLPQSPGPETPRGKIKSKPIARAAAEAGDLGVAGSIRTHGENSASSIRRLGEMITVGKRLRQQPDRLVAADSGIFMTAAV